MSQPLYEGRQLLTTIFAASVATVVTTMVAAHTAMVRQDWRQRDRLASEAREGGFAALATVAGTVRPHRRVSPQNAERSGSVGSVAVPFGGRRRFPLVARALAALGGISPVHQSYDGRGSETTSSEDEGKSVLRSESVGDQRCC